MTVVQQIYPPEEMRDRILACTACTMRAECSRPTPWWPRTDPAFLMMIGRNPGINEDKEGLPFVGRGGKVFQGWLNGLGLSRDEIWLTNLLKCYSLADRKPKQKEITTCWNEHLRYEIAFCRPHFICAMGAEAFMATTGKDRLTFRHGIIYDRREELGAYVIGVIHPGSAMRAAQYKDMMVEDAKILKPLLPLILSGKLLEEGFPTEIEVQ